MTHRYTDFDGTTKYADDPVPFADMPNDLDFDNHAPVTQVTEAMASQRFTRAATPAAYTEPCKRCHGSGLWRGYSRSFTCNACSGRGTVTYKTSPQARVKAAASRERAKANAAQELAMDVAQWRDHHPAEATWLSNNAGRFDFATSLQEALGRFGSLTAGQLAAVQRCIARDVERAAAKAAAPAPTEVRLTKLHTVMQRHAKFYAGALTLSRRNADQLVWIKHADAERVVGKLDNGVLTLWNRPGVDMEYVRDMLNEFEADPLAAAKKFGKLSGRCCSCGRELTNDGSIEAGIGPICAGRFE